MDLDFLLLHLPISSMEKIRLRKMTDVNVQLDPWLSVLAIDPSDAREWRDLKNYFS